jgi:hypothetical protein
MTSSSSTAYPRCRSTVITMRPGVENLGGRRWMPRPFFLTTWGMLPHPVENAATRPSPDHGCVPRPASSRLVAGMGLASCTGWSPPKECSPRPRSGGCRYEPSRVSCAFPVLGRMARSQASGSTRTGSPTQSGRFVNTPKSTTRGAASMCSDRLVQHPHHEVCATACLTRGS